jgi:hypothetical protein
MNAHGRRPVKRVPDPSLGNLDVLGIKLNTNEIKAFQDGRLAS